jgi:predicted regulator of Ras-like GTPase activity (Roadblock/LC7/MglB family)
MQSDKQNTLPKGRTKAELVDDALRKLHLAASGVKASVVVNRDGLLVASYPPGDEDSLLSPTASLQVAAMSATLTGLAERTLARLAQGNFERLMMEGEHGVMVVYPASRATLAVLADKDAQMSRVLFATRKAADEVVQALEGNTTS